jgi:hypothetical protein
MRMCLQVHGVLAGVVTIMFASSSMWADATFTEEARARGLSYVVTQGAFGGPGQYGCGMALFDADGDGDLDFVCSGSDRKTMALFENSGSGTFLDRTEQSGFGSPTKPSGMAAADYDADGDLDLFVTCWLTGPVLFRNDGGLHFTDVTVEAGIITAGVSAGSGVAWADYDADGWIDVLVSNRTQMGALVRNRLYRNLGDGSFMDVAPALGVDDPFLTFQSSWCDLDLDGDLDMYVANAKGFPGFSSNRLFRNSGRGTFVEDISSGANVVMDAMGICFADFTDDLVPDLFLANIGTGNILLRSASGATFTNVVGASGVSGLSTCWGGIAFDADNDGDTDLYFTTSDPIKNFFFERSGPWPFIDSSQSAGLATLGEGYCHVVGDVDADGDLDLFLQQRNENIRLFINQANLIPGRRWVKFQPVGLGTDRQAIGLQIKATYSSGAAWRQVECGSGYKSQSAVTLHVGLGSALTAGSVECRWPNDGGTRTLIGYGANRTWTLYPPARLGDTKGDGDLGADDYADMVLCQGSAFLPGCEIFDFDGNATVDDLDRAAFLGRYCDLTGDAIVGSRDLAELLGRWGNAANSPAEGDFDGSGSVDGADLSLLLAGWN